MARTRMVTRTIKSIEVTCMTYDLETKTVMENVFTVTGETTGKLFDKALEKQAEMAKAKILEIISTESKETLYGMEEEMFLKVAKPITKEQSESGED